MSRGPSIGCGRATGVDVQDLASLREAIGRIFDRLSAKGARACAISLPPDFVPAGDARGARSPRFAARSSTWICAPTSTRRFAPTVFWMLAEFCAEFRLPFDLMIGPVSNVYPAGVAGGRDLFDRRVSLYDYRELFNHFATVKFPVSTLAPDAGSRAGGVFLDLSQCPAHGALVVLERPGLHRGRPEGTHPGSAQGEAAGILLRRLQARVHPAQVQHVPADPGRDPGRGMRAGQGLAARPGARSLAKSSCLTIPEESLDETGSSPGHERFDRGRNDGHVLGTRRTLSASSSPRGTHSNPVPGLPRSHDRSRLRIHLHAAHT